MTRAAPHPAMKGATQATISDRARSAANPAPGNAPRVDEGALARAAAAGDGVAFAALYRRFAPIVHGILLLRVPAADAEDLTQDVFLSAFQRLGSLREGEAVGAWLAAIARNRAVDFHRRRRATVPLPEDGGPGPLPPPTAEAAEALQAIASLPAAYRETLVLRLVEGLTGPEIAQRTGLTPGSVRVNLHRGMALLREALGAGRTT